MNAAVTAVHLKHITLVLLYKLYMFLSLHFICILISLLATQIILIFMTCIIVLDNGTLCLFLSCLNLL